MNTIIHIKAQSKRIKIKYTYRLMIKKMMIKISKLKLVIMLEYQNIKTFLQ